MGQLLVAMPQLADSRFDHATILVCAHDAVGAMGVIVNKPMEDLSLTDLFEQLQINSPPSPSHEPIYYGGPVEPGRGFVLHTDKEPYDNSLQINDDLTLTGTLDILKRLSQGKGPTKKLCLLGFCGWSAGQLEREIQENSWIQAPCNVGLIFDVPPQERWRKTMHSLGIRPSHLSTELGHA